MQMKYETWLSISLDTSIETMSQFVVPSQGTLLYRQLRDERAETYLTGPCGICEFQSRLDCTHLTAEECATLVPARVTTATTAEDSLEVQIYQCGHAFRNQYLVRPGVCKKKYQKGMCIRCLSKWVWDGRAVRVGKVLGASRSPRRGTKKPDAPMAPKRRRGVTRTWVRRGLMVGQAELGGGRTVLF
ncbi:hypothetical protein GGS26DRAFT_556089 [Hypomontagnella submonticulosa]|nr:hypothetical protein GGS26DRAFT_556089 [Hypomontagnella submonticulosa]